VTRSSRGRCSLVSARSFFLATLLCGVSVLLGARCGTGTILTQSRSTLSWISEVGVARIELSRFRLSLLSIEGRKLVATTSGGLAFESHGAAIALGAVESWSRDGETLRLDVASDAGTARVQLRWQTPRSLEVELEPPDADATTAFSAGLELVPGERIYGLAERPGEPIDAGPDVPPANEFFPDETGGLDRRGERVRMVVQPTVALYSPFHQSSAGYGLLVESTTPGSYDLGATDPALLSFRFEAASRAADRRLRLVLFVGPDHAQILDEYTQRTGRPFVPPDWAFLHWRWRDELHANGSSELDGATLNAELADDLRMYEALDIPAGVYLIDRPWTPGEFGFARFDWDPVRFPDPASMLSVLRGRGFRILVFSTVWALGDGAGENRAEAIAGGFLAPRSDRVVDLTNPAAAEWWRRKHVDFMRTWGIDGWKLDRGEEQIPSLPTDLWADGHAGSEVRNEFPLLQAALYHDAVHEVRGDDGLVIARAGWTGSQRHTIAWGGDIPGSEFVGRGLGTDKGLRMALIAQQNAGFLGFPIWGSDTGGYYSFKDREVFARWLEFSAFCAIMEIGGEGSHAPWDMPTEPRYDTEMIEIYRRYVKLHHALAPYTAQHARKAGETGLPVARALVFAFPDDPAVGDLWDEYLYGDDLLVAPVWRSGARGRDVHLPAGEWEDFWDASRRFEGPMTFHESVPLDHIPVYVRAGAEIPGRP
jgi:alpha-D-xyloside xylohydrolase